MTHHKLPMLKALIFFSDYFLMESTSRHIFAFLWVLTANVGECSAP